MQEGSSNSEQYTVVNLANIIGYTIGILLLNKGTSGFKSNTELYRQSNGHMIWSLDHCNVCTTIWFMQNAAFR